MVAVTVEELASSFKVRFRYDPTAVEKIKTIPGRQFRKDLGNAWLIPKTSQRALERFLEWANEKKALKEVERPSVDPQTVYPTRSKGDKPWKHQLAAFRYLWNRKASLLDLKAGSGKSRIFVDFCLNAPEIRRVLILCPKSFVQGWPAQFAKHGGAPVVCAALDDTAGILPQRIQVGLHALREAKERNQLVVVVVNYDVCWRGAAQVVVHKQRDYSPAGYHYEVQVPNDPHFDEIFSAWHAGGMATRDSHGNRWVVQAEGQAAVKAAQHYWQLQTARDGSAYSMEDFLLDSQFDVVGFDEIQRLRSPQARVSKFAHRLGASIPIRIGLSGTPFPETPLDSFGVCRALDASVFGTSFHRYRSRYAVMGGYGNYQVTGYINQQELKAKIDTLRFTMEPEGYDLPEEQDIVIPLVLPEKVQKLYKQLEMDLYVKVGSGEVTIANAAVAFTKLQTICSGFILLDQEDTPHEGKEEESTNNPMQGLRQVSTQTEQSLLQKIQDRDTEVSSLLCSEQTGTGSRKTLRGMRETPQLEGQELYNAMVQRTSLGVGEERTAQVQDRRVPIETGQGDARHVQHALSAFAADRKDRATGINNRGWELNADRVSDDQQKGQTYTGASPGNGANIGASFGKVRTRTSQERNQRRQQAGKSRTVGDAGATLWEESDRFDNLGDNNVPDRITRRSDGRRIKELHRLKQDALADLLDSLPADQSIVVICRFHYDLAAVHNVAEAAGRASGEVSGRPGRPQAHIDGGVWAGPETVLVVQGQSGVEGLDLTRAHVMVFYSYALELGKYTQARARIRRAGQQEPCTFYHLVVRGGIDQKIRYLLERKQHVLKGLLEEPADAMKGGV